MKTCVMTSALAALGLAVSAPAFAQAPEMTASYAGKASYEMDGRTVEAGIRASGKQMRMDMSPEALGLQYGSAMVLDFETGKMISFQTGNVPPEMRMSMVMNSAPLPQANEYAMVVSGSDVIAGERCRNYTFTEQDMTGQLVDYTSCVTDDGINLKTVDGKGEQIFIMTELNRGPQSPALFSAPPGYTEMSLEDLGGLGGLGGLSGLSGGGFGSIPGVTPEGRDKGFVESQAEAAAEDTKTEVSSRVDQERRKVVNDVLGSIFGK